MKQIRLFILVICFSSLGTAQTVVKDSETQQPVSYATISFGNGQGIFADDEGLFIFKEKLYSDVDSLFISALGYEDLSLSTANLPNHILLKPEAFDLDEVVLNITSKKYKVEKLKPSIDDDYFKCWLPTIESEIAVYFPYNGKLQQIESVLFPISVESKDWKKRKQSNAEKKSFSTLFKVKFYKNDNGQPGDILIYENIVFRATEKNAKIFDLNVSEYNITVPKDGLFVSLQVLGYTDKNGKLLPNKKYKEIKTNRGIVKIPTNFRPLLPFTDKISEKRTFVKRVFINDNDWERFEKKNIKDSNLLAKGLNNYGVGLNLRTFKD